MGLVIPSDRPSRYERKVSRVSEWTSSEPSSFFLFPRFRKNNKVFEIYWLFWVWVRIEKEGLYNQVLEDHEVSQAIEQQEKNDEAKQFIQAANNRSNRHQALLNTMFGSGPGFAVFTDRNMAAYCPISRAHIVFRRDTIDVTSLDTPNGHREFIAGPLTADALEIQTEDIIILQGPPLINEDHLTMLYRLQDGTFFESVVICTSLETSIGRNIPTSNMEGLQANASFLGAGSIINITK